MADSDKNLEFLIKLGVVGKDDVVAAMKKVADDTEASRNKNEQLEKTIAKLTADYPLLGEAADAALNPIVMAVTGPIVAYEIWQTRIDALTRALGGIEMPDLTSGINQAAKLAELWNGVAQAIEKANTTFNSTESVFKRTESGIDKQLASDKKLNEVKRDQALANLELKKSSMTDGHYKIAKAGIESFYANEDNKLEKNADNKRLRAKEKEIWDTDMGVRDLAAKEKKFKLNPNQAVEDQNLKDMQGLADGYHKQAEAARQEVGKINDLQTDQADGFLGQVRSIPASFAFASKYGYSATEAGDKQKQDQVKKEREQIAKEAEEKEFALEKQIADRKDRAKQRDDIRSQLVTMTNKAQTLHNEAPEEADDRNRTNEIRDAIHQGHEQINATKLVADLSQGGSNIVGAINAIRAASADKDAAIITALKKLESLHKNTSNQIKAVGNGQQG